MENNRTTKVLIIIILLIVAVQFAITLFSKGEANNAIKEMKAAREEIGQAMKNLNEARESISNLAGELETAQNNLKALDQQVEQLDHDMNLRLTAVNKQLANTLQDIRKENETIVALQKKLSTLHDYENF